MSLGRKVMERLETLAACSDEPGALTRLYLGNAHRAAADLVRGWMEMAGMATRIDAVGNVLGRIEGRMPGLPALVLGSHIDTVRHAGKYDGNLGVVTAIEAVAASRNLAAALPFALEVVAFGDEEGVRFKSTLTGSRAFAGTLDPAIFADRDGQGISLAEALRGFGGDPDAAAAAARRPEEVLAYVEVHIEQGPVLEAEDTPLGIVTAIAGASRFVFTVQGVAGHAGTVPMALRQDALTAAAEMILAIERVARETESLVATVGQAEILPGAVNTVPGEVRFTLDVRSPDDSVRLQACRSIAATCRAIAEKRGVVSSIEPTHEAAAVACAPWLQELLREAVGALGIRPLSLPSGAGHDGMAVAALAPIAMLFVRCRGGISHNPAESIALADADLATQALIGFITRFKDRHG